MFVYVDYIMKFFYIFVLKTDYIMLMFLNLRCRYTVIFITAKTFQLWTSFNGSLGVFSLNLGDFQLQTSGHAEDRPLNEFDCTGCCQSQCPILFLFTVLLRNLCKELFVNADV